MNYQIMTNNVLKEMFKPKENTKKNKFMAEWIDCQDGVGGYQGIDDVKGDEGEE